MATPEEAFVKATRARAKVYHYLYEELLSELGEEKAEEIFSKAIYKYGIDNSNVFSDRSRESAGAFAGEFVKDPIGRSVFSQTILTGDKDRAVIEMKNCPLVQQWLEIGLPPEKVRRLCDIAHQVDFGTIEGKGFNLKFPTRISYGEGSCVLEISRRE